MGYFDGLAASSFKKDSSGKTLYYPFGIFGRGYVIPNDKKEKSIRSSLKRFYVIALPILIGTGILFGWLYAILLLIPVLLWAILLPKSLVKGLHPCATKMKVSDSIDSSARAHSKGMLWFLFLASSFFTLTGLFILISDPEKSILALSTIAFFGLGTFIMGRMLLRRIKIDRSRISFK